MSTQFPQGFYWGTATASFQIEGATKADGRGESIWDRFAATPGKIRTGETGDPACESYHRYAEDIALMQAMNLNAYRFSIAWPRVIPDGSGTVNDKGLDYYDRLVDALLAAGITPLVTLYHWDLPQRLQDEGGWANRASIEAFVRYADVTVARLGDRVKNWTTLNEPWCVSILSNLIGEHAPGLSDLKTALQVAHNILVAHGAAVPVIRKRCPDAQVGIVLNFEPAFPVTDSEADRRLARMHHATFNEWFIGPVMGHGYPQNAWLDYGENVPEVLPGDMEIIAAPVDYLGVNYYTRHLWHDPSSSDGARVLHQRDEGNVSARGWEIYPQGLYDIITWLHKTYDIPRFLISENGMARDDQVAEDGAVHDPERISYIRQHLEVVLRLISEHIPITGYMCWSLMDNFEWAFGTSSRFGLAYVNFETQERFLKDSGRWYGRVAGANALVD
ncbi:MAG: beta-glucosidase [Anaerolineae bacterium]|nr:beta-glucosidase [Anaerolineae bacterium]